MSETITINSLGHLGDGIADGQKGRVIVPFSLPGEQMVVDPSARPVRIVEIRQASELRVDPICTHFGTCGGCQVQHFRHEHYLKWKRNLLIEALRAQSIDVAVEPILDFPGAQRRRAVFKGRNVNQQVELGFTQKGSHNLVDLKECPILTPTINNNLDAIKQALAPILSVKGFAEINVLDCNGDLDIHVELKKRPPNQVLETVIKRILQSGIARCALNGEILIERRRPKLNMGLAEVSIPPASFVQAVEAAEQVMVDLVKSHLKGCKQVVDLFCGSGTFSLPLAEQSTVSGYENGKPALEALDQAWRSTGGRLKQLGTEKRDLFRSPVLFGDLKKFQGAVFDPPRAGAEAQARQLAMSKVRKIAAVSCNPVTLANDLRILIEGGFKINSITPIDQFIYTPHLEAVALLER